MTTAVTTTDRIAGTWRLAPVHSSVGFAVKYVVATFRANFSDIEATLRDGILSGRVSSASVSVTDSTFLAHLLGADFLDAEHDPEISFSSSSLQLDGDQVTVDGDLTLRSVTREIRGHGQITGPALEPRGSERLGLSLTATIDRTDFGLAWNAPLPGGGVALANDVDFVVELEFVKVP